MISRTLRFPAADVVGVLLGKVVIGAPVVITAVEDAVFIVEAVVIEVVLIVVNTAVVELEVAAVDVAMTVFKPA